MSVTSFECKYCGVIPGESHKEDCKEMICDHCGGSKHILNPKGFCNHYEYPNSCEVCLKGNKRVLKVAFDIDDTLWKIRRDHGDQVPDYDLIAVLRWFYKNGDKVFVWSAGGVDYAKSIVRRLGLDDMVEVIVKEKRNDIDVAFDDAETGLAKVDVPVKRT